MLRWIGPTMRMSEQMYACCNEKTTLKRHKPSQTIINRQRIKQML